MALSGNPFADSVLTQPAPPTVVPTQPFQENTMWGQQNGKHKLQT